MIPRVAKKEDLMNVNQSINDRVMVEETWTVWKYDCVLMVWTNTGMAE